MVALIWEGCGGFGEGAEEVSGDSAARREGTGGLSSLELQRLRGGLIEVDTMMGGIDSIDIQDICSQSANGKY